MNRIHWTLGAVVGVSTLALGAFAARPLAQAPKPPVIATDIYAADVQAVIKHPTGGGDRLITAVDKGTYNVGVGV